MDNNLSKNIAAPDSRMVNYFTIGFLGVVCIPLIAELMTETEWNDRADDLAITILGIIAVLWYRMNPKRDAISWVPTIFVALALIIKLIALKIEMGDEKAVGDDIGVGITLVVMLLVTLWQNYKLRK